MQQCRYRLVLVAAVFDDKGRDSHQMGNIGDGRALARLIAVQPVGNPVHRHQTILKVVGGHGAEATELACALYDQISARTVPVSSVDTAEAVKLIENVFRAVNIALVNELKVIYARMGIDIWEVIEAAKTKPFGFMPFYPGSGLGGHCIPIDPFYLTWRAAVSSVPAKPAVKAGHSGIRLESAGQQANAARPSCIEVESVDWP